MKSIIGADRQAGEVKTDGSEYSNYKRSKQTSRMQQIQTKMCLGRLETAHLLSVCAFLPPACSSSISMQCIIKDYSSIDSTLRNGLYLVCAPPGLTLSQCQRTTSFWRLAKK